MTALRERDVLSILEDMDDLILSMPYESAISNEFLLTEGGTAPLTYPVFKARLARLEASPIFEELLPTLDLMIEKADTKDYQRGGGSVGEAAGRVTGKVAGRLKDLKTEWLGSGGKKKYLAEGFSRRPGGSGGRWQTADSSKRFASWSSVGKVQAGAKGFTSGFKRQLSMELAASKKPDSKMFREDPRNYWKERGKLASEYASTMEGINDGSIKGVNADKLMGLNDRGKDVSGLSSSDQERRAELLAKNPNDFIKEPGVRELKEKKNKQGEIIQEARAGKPAIDEAKELRTLTAGLSLRERAEGLGTNLDMVEYHVNQINDSGSSLKRRLNPGLNRVAPPVGNWPESLGGAATAERLNKNWQKVAANYPKGQKGSLDRQYQAHAQGQGKFAPTAPAHSYKDREYLKTGEKPPKGVREYTSPRGKRYYLRSEHKILEEQEAPAVAPKESEEAAEAAEAAEEPTGEEKKPARKRRKKKVAVTAGGEEEEVEDSDTGEESSPEPPPESSEEPSEEPEAEQPEPSAKEESAEEPEVAQPESAPEEESAEEPKAEQEEVGLWQHIKNEYGKGKQEGLEFRVQRIQDFYDQALKIRGQKEKKKEAQAEIRAADKEAFNEVKNLVGQYGKQQAQKILREMKGLAGDGLQRALNDVDTVVKATKPAREASAAVKRRSDREARKARVLGQRAAKRLGRRGRVAARQAMGVLNDVLRENYAKIDEPAKALDTRIKVTVNDASKKIIANFPKDKDEAVALVQTLYGQALGAAEKLPSDAAVYDVIDNVADEVARLHGDVRENIRHRGDVARRKLGIPRMRWGGTNLLGRAAKAPTPAQMYGVAPAKGQHKQHSLTRRMGLRLSDDGFFELGGYFFKEDIQIQTLLLELNDILIPDPTSILASTDAFIGELENGSSSAIANELISLSDDDAYDLLDRIEKGGEVFLKGYIESFNTDLDAELEASELLQLIDGLSTTKI